MKELYDGHRRFRHEVFPAKEARFKNLAKAQAPEALFITCSDSRIDPCLFTRSDPGVLFTARNIGNCVPVHGCCASESATIEYAIRQLKVRHIVVCGHSDCGAMKAMLNADGLEALANVANWLSLSPETQELAERLRRSGGDAQEQLAHLTRQHVLFQMQNLLTHPAAKEALASGELILHGWVFDIEQGKIFFHNVETNEFGPVQQD
jgi:carbonic anhydrase